jgi:hypothetical protein
MGRETGSFYLEINPFCTQKRTVPTHHRVPDALRWCSRLAMDVGEGQKRTRCIDSPVRRRGGVEWGEKRGHFTWKSTPSAHRNGPFRPTTAFQMPSVGVLALPRMWAKARSERGALIRLRGDGVVSNGARNGVILLGNQPLLHTETDRSDPPPRSRCPPLVFPPCHGCGRRPEANEVH